MIYLENLPELKLVPINFSETLSGLKKQYELATGYYPAPSSPESFLLDLMTYQEILIKEYINSESRKNLLYYANAERLEHLAAFYGISRLPAQPAACQVELTVTEKPSPYSIINPIRLNASQIEFVINPPLTIEANTSKIIATAIATTTGTIGNGFVAGEITQIISPVPDIQSAKNITMTFGGSDIETDDKLRNRIRLAPDQFSTAGTKETYKFYVLNTHQDIVDVHIWQAPFNMEDIYNLVKISMDYGDTKEQTIAHLNNQATNLLATVNVSFLLKDGALPDQKIMSDVYLALTNSKIKPLTDRINVIPPVPINYSISASIQLADPTTSHQDILATATTRLTNLTQKWQNTLGQDIIPEIIISELQTIPGVYRVFLNEPAYTKCAEDYSIKYPVCNNINIVVE